MALKPLLSFSSGELDPILQDQVTLEKFNKGLATARNVMIGKTGAILSRFSRRFVRESRLNDNNPIKIYQPPNTQYLLEFGVDYLRLHYDINEFGSGAFDFTGTGYTKDDVQKLHFTTSQGYVYIFCDGKEMKKFFLGDDNVGTARFLNSSEIFHVPAPIIYMGVFAFGTPSGYPVDYFATLVINGEETLGIDTLSFLPSGVSKPIEPGQRQEIEVRWPKSLGDVADVNEVRIYSRPHKAGAFGYLGSTTSYGDVTGEPTLNSAKFTDIGSLPDYNNGTQDLITNYGLKGEALLNTNPRTGTVYQQRLILTTDIDREALIASRPGYKNNFYRDFPYAADSALLFKAGTSGQAFVLRIIENEGLVVFTTNGVYTNVGLLGPNNIALERRGAWIINVDIPPLLVPGGLFFVDTSNTIRQMVFSQEILAYESVEQTIFSNHLFKTRKIKSWCYQNGTAPLILVTFSDGTFALFTYNFEHQMRAWTRHDSKYPIEQVEGTVEYDKSYIVTNKNGRRQIEVTLPRYISAETFITDKYADMKMLGLFADSMRQAAFVSSGELEFTVEPVVPGDWSGQLKCTYPDQELPDNKGPWYPYVLAPDAPQPRFYHPITKNLIIMNVISSEQFETIFEPSEEFPSEFAVNPLFFTPYNRIWGLEHLEGESVVVVADGSIVASPYNDKEGYPECIVTGGEITLPDDMYAGIIVVGRPIVADVKSLNVSTVEQSPTLLESINVNKMYVRVQDSRCLYVANNFPEEAEGKKDGNSVEEMDAMDTELVPPMGIIGNAYFPPKSRRCEITMRGDWSNQGQVAIRQVDPYHFEILSIIPDITVLPRSDR